MEHEARVLIVPSLQIFSVWNAATRAYDYYKAHGKPAIHAGAPPRAESNALGATPDEAAWPLPANAVKTGSGEMPQGRIASTGDRGGIDLKTSIIYGVLGYALWKMLK